MNVFACAIALLSAVQMEVATAAPARDLYGAAAKHLASHETARAIEALQTLTNNYPDSPIAAVAAVHLAECLVSHDRPAEAYDLLRAWESRIKGSKAAKRIEPELNVLFSNILIRSARQRSAELESHHDFVGAIAWQRLVSDEPSGTVDKQREILRLAVAGCLHQARHGETFEPIIETVEEGTRAAARFAVAEMFATRGYQELAARQYELLSELTEHMDVSSRPEWAATVALRRAELLIADKQYAVAAELLSESKAAYGNFATWFEYDFLLTRCAIANIEFDQAKRHLQNVKLDGTVQVDTRCKATWLLGELLFLQRDYTGALKEYEQVLSEKSLQWRARALLQMAKCQELSGQVQLAQATYKTLHQEYSNSDEATEALSRISALQSALNHR